MKLYFKKDYNPDKPKRWYVFPVDGSGDPEFGRSDLFYFNPSEPIIFKSQTYAYVHIRNKIGLVLGSKSHICSCPSKEYYAWYNMFLYFRSHADEAEFLMKISNEEIEI
jgi:hypothetical protein